MAQKHTPGPWEVRDEMKALEIIGWAKSEHYPNPKQKDGLWPQIVTTIKAGRKGAKRGGSIWYLPFNEKEKANARLIAAAPTLLEACKEMIKVGEKASANQGYDNTPGIWLDHIKAVKKIRQAVAKATSYE